MASHPYFQKRRHFFYNKLDCQISILPTFSNFFEKTYLIHIVNFLEEHKFLLNNQFGFWNGKSTVGAVLSLVNTIVEGIESLRDTLLTIPCLYILETCIFFVL